MLMSGRIAWSQALACVLKFNNASLVLVPLLLLVSVFDPLFAPPQSTTSTLSLEILPKELSATSS